jgi:hypothetical protein
MSISKRTWTTPSGEAREAWVDRYRDADGKQRLKTFKLLRDAKAWDRCVKDELEKGVHRPDSTSLTVRQAGSLLLERCKADGLEPEAISKYEQHLRLHIVPAIAVSEGPNRWVGELGDVKLSRLTTPMCDAFKCIWQPRRPGTAGGPPARATPSLGKCKVIS